MWLCYSLRLTHNAHDHDDDLLETHLLVLALGVFLSDYVHYPSCGHEAEGQDCEDNYVKRLHKFRVFSRYGDSYRRKLSTTNTTCYV